MAFKLHKCTERINKKASLAITSEAWRYVINVLINYKLHL